MYFATSQLKKLASHIIICKRGRLLLARRGRYAERGFTRVAVETANQFVARKTYSNFLQKLGGNAKHANWVLDNGYGYKATVANMRKLLNVLNIDENLFTEKANKLLMQDYTDFDKKIIGLIEKMSNRKDIIDIFGFIEHKQFDNYLKIFNQGV